MAKGKTKRLRIPAAGGLKRRPTRIIDFDGVTETAQQIKMRLALVNRFLEVLDGVPDEDPRKPEAIAEYNRQKRIIERRLVERERVEAKQMQFEGKTVPESTPSKIPPTVVRLKTAVMNITAEKVQKE